MSDHIPQWHCTWCQADRLTQHCEQCGDTCVDKTLAHVCQWAAQNDKSTMKCAICDRIITKEDYSKGNY